ncbi:class I SAM-dependent methyltransferase [Treponema primitia]|uniref:class I SAM-dependent methyltransferase n=1 Tax=Treponema primitia TaxID=88058 RepID=UPI0039801740
MEKNIVNNQCPICSFTSNTFSSIEYLNTLFNTSIFLSKKIIICPECGFGFLDSYFEQNDLNQFYANHYRYGSVFQRSVFSDAFRIPYRAIAQLLLVNTFISQVKVENILDIGAGHGDIFDIAKIIFNKSQYYAFEPDNSTQVKLEKKYVNIFKELFSAKKDYADIKQRFDIIIMSHVLEHFNGHDILSVLKNISYLLSNKGVALIEVPNDDMEYNGKHRENDAPHLSFFTIESLTKAIKNSDLELLYITTCGITLEEEFNIQSNITQKSKLKEIVKKIPLLKCFYTFLKFIISIVKYMLHKHDYRMIISNKYFMYGDDRIWIRAIVKKKN